METRQIIQGHIYYLVLNCMYDRCEDRNIVAISEDRNKLINFYESNLLPYEERYRDETGMYRSFMKGPLYEYNPAMYESLDDCIKDEWFMLDDIDRIKMKYYVVE